MLPKHTRFTNCRVGSEATYSCYIKLGISMFLCITCSVYIYNYMYTFL